MHEDVVAAVGVSHDWQGTPVRVTTNTDFETSLIKQCLDQGYRTISRDVWVAIWSFLTCPLVRRISFLSLDGGGITIGACLQRLLICNWCSDHQSEPVSSGMDLDKCVTYCELSYKLLALLRSLSSLLMSGIKHHRPRENEQERRRIKVQRMKRSTGKTIFK